MRLTSSLIVAAFATTLVGCATTAVPTAPAPAPAATAQPAAAAPTVTLTQGEPEADTADVAPPKAVADLMAAPKLADASLQSVTDPWRPSAFTISDTDHDAVTLSWRTSLPARATVYYAKSFGFDFHGFTNAIAVDASRTSQTLRIPGLSRFTRYRFVVVGLGPVGMQFPSYAIEQRTALFF